MILEVQAGTIDYYSLGAVSHSVVLFLWHNSPTRTRAASLLRFLDNREWYTTVGRTLLDEGSARRKGLYVHNTATNTRDRYPCPQWDSNSQSQQAIGRRPSPYTPRLLGSVPVVLIRYYFTDWMLSSNKTTVRFISVSSYLCYMFRPVSGHDQVDVQSYNEKIMSGWNLSFTK